MSTIFLFETFNCNIPVKMNVITIIQANTQIQNSHVTGSYYFIELMA